MLYKYNNINIARKAFEEGETIIIVPHKVNPNNCWDIELIVQKDSVANTLTNQTYKTLGFDVIVDRYKLFNCNYENGYYCSFYVDVKIKR